MPVGHSDAGFREPGTRMAPAFFRQGMVITRPVPLVAA